MHAFSYILGFSRLKYIHFVQRQDFDATIREHIRAFTHVGGLAAECLYDNMKVVVTGYDGGEPIYTLSGLCDILRLPAGGWPSLQATNEGQGRKAILFSRDEPA